MNAAFFANLAQSLRAGQAVCVATVLETRGAVPRHRGAMLWLSRSHGTEVMQGSVGGGLLEAQVLMRARTLLDAGERQASLRIDLSGKPESAGICGGQLHISLTRWLGADAAHRAQTLAEALAAGMTIELAADEIGLAVDAEPLRIEPEPLLLICGAGHCGQALAQQAAWLGFRLVVQDPRPEQLAHPAFEPARSLQGEASLLRELAGAKPLYAVLLNRDWASDLACLAVLAEMPPDYVGMMGSRRRVAAVRSAMPDLELKLPHLDAPLGFEIGAETPEEIAISILARLIAHRRLNRPHSPP